MLESTIEGMVKRRTPGLDTEKLVQKFLQIAQMLSGNKLYPYQLEFGARIIECVLERQLEELTALFSRQSGKTETIAAVCGALMLLLPEFARKFPGDDRFCFLDKKSGAIRTYNGGFWVGLFAPKKEQAGIAFNRMKSFFRRETSQQLAAELGLTFDTFNGDTVSLSNGSFVKCFTASDQANIEGHTLNLAIMDESQDISDEKATKSIGPMLAATGGSIVKIGTANARKSHFYNAIRRNERRHLEGAAKNHFFVDWKQAASYSELYDAFVKKEMLRLGERSDEFQMAYNCRFMLHRGQAIDEASFEARCVTIGGFSNVLSGPRRGMHYVGGLDFGKLHDSTVATVLEVDWDNPREVLEGFDNEKGSYTIEIFGKHVCAWLEIQGDDYESQYHQLREWFRPWNLERLALDYTGVGLSLGDRFKVLYDGIDVEFVTFSDDSKDALGRQLLSDIATLRLTWPGGEEVRTTREWQSFRSQLLDWEKDYKRGLLDLHHPEIRGAHDDYGWSLGLAVHAANHRPFGGEIEVTSYR